MSSLIEETKQQPRHHQHLLRRSTNFNNAATTTTAIRWTTTFSSSPIGLLGMILLFVVVGVQIQIQEIALQNYEHTRNLEHSMTNLRKQLQLTSTPKKKKQLPSSPPPSTSATGNSSNVPNYYQGSTVENYIYKNRRTLGYDQMDGRTDNHDDPTSNRPEGCKIFLEEKTTNKEIYETLQDHHLQLKEYNQLLDEFELPEGVKDLRLHLDDAICDQLELHPNGLQGIFRSGALSNYTGNNNNVGSSSSFGEGQGLLEPLLPPLRDPDYCYHPTRENILSLGYLVHDFAQLCRQLKRHSRIVLVDMGASLEFHDREKEKEEKEKSSEGPATKIDRSKPAMYLTSLYEKFGFVFDHIYAFEVKPKKPSKVFKKIPQSLMAAYHWNNVGVSAEVGHKLNPLTMLLENFDPVDDIIILKLDIDTPQLEMPLAYQILQDSRLNKMINHFYFEQHVHLKELQADWTQSMNGTVSESLELFRQLRERGIAAHYWV